MLRRPLTNVELKLDDIREYEYMRQQAAKEQDKQSKNFNESTTNWATGPKSTEEVYSRIGYVPQCKQGTRGKFL